MANSNLGLGMVAVAILIAACIIARAHRYVPLVTTNPNAMPTAFDTWTGNDANIELENK
jgi:hypothetical protein